MRNVPLVLLLAVAGCGGGGDDLSTHDGIADAMISTLGDLVTTIEGIKDKKDAEAARPRLKAIADRLSAIDAAVKKLGEPVGEEKERLKAKIDAATAKIDPRMEAAIARLRTDPEAWAIVDGMMAQAVGSIGR